MFITFDLAHLLNFDCYDQRALLPLTRFDQIFYCEICN